MTLIPLTHEIAAARCCYVSRGADRSLINRVQLALSPRLMRPESIAGFEADSVRIVKAAGHGVRCRTVVSAHCTAVARDDSDHNDGRN
jgi:hypothetical protein